MSNPTSNFNWQMPTNTDLVSQLPADFEVFGQAVDTSLADLKGGTTGQVLKKNTDTDMDFVWAADAAGMTNPMTTTGDTIYSSSGSTPARLGIGSTGNVLTVAAGVPSWAAPAAPNANYTLVNAGGTSLSGSSVTISGISGANEIFILVINARSTVALANRIITFNGDTGSNYGFAEFRVDGNTTYSASNYSYDNNFSTTGITLTRSANATASRSAGYLSLSGGNSSGVKTLQYAGGSDAGGADNQVCRTGGGAYFGTSTISSVTLATATGSFNLGTIYVYKA